MGVFTASLRSACSLRRGHFVNNLKGPVGPFRSVRTDWNYSTSMAFSSLNASSRRVIIVTWAARNHTRGS
ncbi:hypothetical protein CQP46_08275 [Yersinia pestis]|nr:hypothetical protein [Yersinia pestis]